MSKRTFSHEDAIEANITRRFAGWWTAREARLSFLHGVECPDYRECTPHTVWPAIERERERRDTIRWHRMKRRELRETA